MTVAPYIAYIEMFRELGYSGILSFSLGDN